MGYLEEKCRSSDNYLKEKKSHIKKCITVMQRYHNALVTKNGRIRKIAQLELKVIKLENVY